jgi:hypothetical protein
VSEPVRSLEDAAKLLAAAQQERDAAQAEVDRLKPDYKAAESRLWKAREEVERIEKGMAAAHQAYAVASALNEAGTEHDGPPVVIVAGPLNRPVPYFLVAVAKEGTGLYLHTPSRSHRYQGKEYAIRIADANAHGVTEEPDRRHRGEHGKTWRNMVEVGLWKWQERGKGDFGYSGAVKPAAPPEGGRWKWLKVKEQREIEA